MASLPLEGVRVVAFSTAFAGPTTSRYLADYGAEVIKVESLRRPDNTRNTASGYSEPSGAATSPTFQHFNRNKRDIAINLSHERGRELMRDLLRQTDVVTENFSGRVMQTWGLDYASLRQVKPDVILLDMQGLGLSGPRKDYISYGSNLHSYSPLTSVWGYSHSFIVDYMAAAHAVFAVLAALHHRERTGEGTHIELSQVEAVAALLGTHFLDYFANGTVPQALGNSSPNFAPHNCYRCAGEDAWCVVAVTDDAAWPRLCAAIGRPDWAADDRLATRAGRLAHVAELDAGVGAWTSQHTPVEVEAQLQVVGVSAAAVRTRADMVSDPHLAARGFPATIQHSLLGTQTHVGLSIHLSATPGRTAGPAPLLGQDNVYVFGELLGLPESEIAELTSAGVLA